MAKQTEVLLGVIIHRLHIGDITTLSQETEGQAGDRSRRTRQEIRYLSHRSKSTNTPSI